MAENVSRRSGLRSRRTNTLSKEERFWRDFRRRISAGQVIPIVSNSVRNDRIFDIDFDYNLGLMREKANLHAEILNIKEELAEEWAKEIGYPLPDKHRLTRVAVYNRTESRDDMDAKTEYLWFLKEYLLDLAEEDEEVEEVIPVLREDLETLSFTDIAEQLNYPRFEDPAEDPLALLAQLPLPIYATTSHHDFLERALEDAGKEPRTQVCFLFGEPPNVDPKHRIDPDFVPSPDAPVVYHLHGYELYPESLVISEDDYLDFLVRVLDERRETKDPFIPQRLSEALSMSSVVLLGYRLHDWDFRVIFRGLIKTKPIGGRKYGLAIQLDPVEQRLAMANLDSLFSTAIATKLGPYDYEEIPEDHAARTYLKKYFESEKFSVEWGTVHGFVKQLCDRWDEWRGGRA